MSVMSDLLIPQARGPVTSDINVFVLLFDMSGRRETTD